MVDIRAKKAWRRVIIAFLACLFGSTACCAGIRITNEFARVQVENAARRVGADPSIEGIGQYIVDSIDVGMSGYEVEQILGIIAPLDVERGSLKDTSSGWGTTRCDKISLKLSLLPGHVWRIIACYDTKDNLVLLKSADPDSFPSLDVYAPSHE